MLRQIGILIGKKIQIKKGITALYGKDNRYLRRNEGWHRVILHDSNAIFFFLAEIFQQYYRAFV